MDLRAPLHNITDGIDFDGKMPHSNEEVTAPWLTATETKVPSTIDNGLYERIVYHLLCRMYVASQMMELGTESRFTGLILFHRYVRHFYCLLQQQQQQQQNQSDQTTQGKKSSQEMNQIKSHLGSVAAACLFLGCKMEEEPRRIRDVINLSHVLNFSSWDDDDTDADFIKSTNLREQREQLKKLPENIIKPITIVESLHPPPLDENYWAAKEQMVSTEQHVLRMIRFDTTVCHPHRCVLTIMDTLGFGTGKNHTRGNENERQSKSLLLTSNQSENVILRAWKVLNEAPLDPKGIALHHPVIVLSCAAISLAAEGGIGIKDINDGGKLATLPEFWWRALDVSTSDIEMARGSLQKVLH